MSESKLKRRHEHGEGEEHGDVCAGHALGFPLRSELGFLPIENLTLDVFRCLCDVYATGSAQPWEIAVKMAEENLGPADGPLLVARVTAFLRALRSERKHGFSYLSIGCQHASPDELAAAGLVKSVRMNDKAAVERGITLLLGPSHVGAKTRAATRLLASAQLVQLSRDGDISDRHDFEAQTLEAIYLH